jgi:hypothetical protein
MFELRLFGLRVQSFATNMAIPRGDNSPGDGCGAGADLIGAEDDMVALVVVDERDKNLEINNSGSLIANRCF